MSKGSKKRVQSPAKQLARLGLHLAGKLAAKSKQHQAVLLDSFLKGWPIDVQISVEPPQEYLRALELEAARNAEQAYLESLSIDARLQLAAQMAEKGYGPMQEGIDPLEWLMDRRSGSDETNRVETDRLDAQIEAKQAEIDAAVAETEPAVDASPSFQLHTGVIESIEPPMGEIVVPFSQVEGDLDNEPETVVTVTEIDQVEGVVTFDTPAGFDSPECDITCPEGQVPVLRGNDAGEDEFWECTDGFVKAV